MIYLLLTDDKQMRLMGRKGNLGNKLKAVDSDGMMRDEESERDLPYPLYIWDGEA